MREAKIDTPLKTSFSLRNPTQRFVDGNHTRKDLRLRLRHGLLGLQLRALGVEQRQEIGDALAIARASDRGSACALSRLIVELHEPLLLLAIIDQRVFGLFERAQYCLLV